MSNVIKKVGILLAVFVAAVVIYFIWNQNQNQKEEAQVVYTTMEEATLPLVYAQMFGNKTNPMHGYLQPSVQASDRESLTILPADRMLNLHILPYEQTIKAVRYEIRSLDFERLVERTELTGWTEEEGQLRIVLPIQNLLIKESEYMLDVVVETETQPEIHYYTRIMWSDNPNVQQMIEFATDFSSKTFQYDDARELVTYLETNSTEDNSSLGTVTIRSSFSQLTWGDLGVKPEGEIAVTLKELNGIMANVQLDFMVTGDSEEGKQEFYRVSENFTMKWNSQRIYLMDYIRHMNEYFDGKASRFSGKRIMLGITDDNHVDTLKSPNKQHMAFVSNGDLWRYSEKTSDKEPSATRIFSFSSQKDDSLRSSYDRHRIKILATRDSGNVDFLVYGYMNRGVHEGLVGVAMYRYDSVTEAITEKFFVPSTESFSLLAADIEKLSYLSPNDMLYIMMNRAVYGIELNSNESLVVADAMEEGNYAVSASGRGFAWQESSEAGGTPSIHVIDFETGHKQDIQGGSGELLRVLGYVGEDFIYGLAREEGRWVVNGRLQELPMYAMEIVDENLVAETRYQQDGYYISNVQIQDSRIHMERIVKTSEDTYQYADEDTLVSNNAVLADLDEGIGWYASTSRRKLYFAQAEQEIKTGKTVKIQAAGAISYESSGMLELKSNQALKDDRYYTYAQGEFRGSCGDFTDAVNLIYDGMGIVTDSRQQVLWSRVDRSTAKNIRDPEAAARKLIKAAETGLDPKSLEEGITALDARGCILNQVLYFIDKGCPVIAYRENGQYYLISGYDQYNITLYDPSTKETMKMGLQDGADYFKSMKNDFLCAVLTK